MGWDGPQASNGGKYMEHETQFSIFFIWFRYVWFALKTKKYFRF